MKGEQTTDTTKTKEPQKILLTVISQQIGQHRRNGPVSRNLQPAKT